MLYNVLKSFLTVAAGNKEIRSYLRGIRIAKRGDCVLLDASDGHISIRLETNVSDAKCLYNLSFETENDYNVILEREALAAVLKLMVGKKPQTTLIIDEERAILNGYHVGYVQNKYPNICRIYHKKMEYALDSMGINLDQMARLCKAFKGAMNSKPREISAANMSINSDVLSPMTLSKHIEYVDDHGKVLHSVKLTGLIMPVRNVI